MPGELGRSGGDGSTSAAGTHHAILTPGLSGECLLRRVRGSGHSGARRLIWWNQGQRRAVTTRET
ncbi:MAG: hypothetical protein KGJ41_18710, partial [Rhodospirillales bacterium]|nr:hypothetical protein [Rhodospirillales bacterium]